MIANLLQVVNCIGNKVYDHKYRSSFLLVVLYSGRYKIWEKKKKRLKDCTSRSYLDQLLTGNFAEHVKNESCKKFLECLNRFLKWNKWTAWEKLQRKERAKNAASHFTSLVIQFPQIKGKEPRIQVKLFPDFARLKHCRNMFFHCATIPEQTWVSWLLLFLSHLRALFPPFCH